LAVNGVTDGDRSASFNGDTAAISPVHCGASGSILLKGELADVSLRLDFQRNGTAHEDRRLQQ
jgi:hypothetical protein